MIEIPCCLSVEEDLVKARTVGRNDRRAFATRSIEAGRVVLRNAPLAHVSHVAADQRCAYCLIPASGTNNGKLARCGRCKVTYYCSRTCQRSDFACHKVECRAITTTTTTTSNLLNNDTKLLLRTYGRLQTIDTECRKETTQQEHEDEACSVIHCGMDHFQNMARFDNSVRMGAAMKEFQIEEQRQLEDIVSKAASILLTHSNKKTGVGDDDKISKQRQVIQSQLKDYTSVFRVNNFGIMDSMMNVVGGGVYPLGALLNHSCQPNCLLRFWIRPEQPPTMEIVACRKIQSDEELTHSYVELVAMTEQRQEQLQGIYGFTCKCPRCQGHCTVQLPRELREPNLAMDLTMWLLQRHNPYFKSNKGKTASLTQVAIEEVELDAAIRVPLSDINNALLSTVETLRQQAKQHMTSDNVEGELQCLEQAVSLLLSCGGSSLSRELYRVRGDLLGAYIVAGNVPRALAECQHVVAFLCVALVHVPNHPLLGLQLFALGDLLEASLQEGGGGGEAQCIYEWASQILTVSQGRDSEMVRLLNDKLNRQNPN